MKKFSKLFSLLLTVVLAFTLVACGGDDSSDGATTPGGNTPAKLQFSNVSLANQTFNYNGETHELAVSGDIPAGTTVVYSNNGKVEEGDYQVTATLKKAGYQDKTLNAKLTIVEPTAEQVVSARANTVSQDYQGFDYQYKLNGALSVLGIEGNVEGVYDAQYRENKTSGEIAFKRTTSGELLIDSTKYVYYKGNQLITLKMGDGNTVKKVSNATVDEIDESFIHIPIENLINSVAANELKNIQRSSDIQGYKYKSNLQFAANNEKLNKLLTAVSLLGSTVSFKGVEITNPVNGIILYFNYGKGDRIEDFYLSINLTIPSSIVDFTLNKAFTFFCNSDHSLFI